MDPGSVGISIGNTIGAVIIGWGFSSLFVVAFRGHTLSSHLTRVIASSACYASKSGHTISDTQMTTQRINSWCVHPDRAYYMGLANSRMCVGRCTMVRHPTRSHSRFVLTVIRTLEALHQAFVGHIAWFYIVE